VTSIGNFIIFPKPKVQNTITHMTKVPDAQRISVLQGGGSLGAYEAGTYQAIYENIRI
jgi:hypothetical protein